MGQLYLGNASSAWVEYELNGGGLTRGRPFSSGPTPPRFTPLFITAGLARERSPGILGYDGDDEPPNALLATFVDEVEPTRAWLFRIRFPETESLEDDLFSLAFRGRLLFADKRGSPIPPNPLVIVGEPATGASVPTSPQTSPRPNKEE